MWAEANGNRLRARWIHAYPPQVPTGWPMSPAAGRRMVDPRLSRTSAAPLLMLIYLGPTPMAGGVDDGVFGTVAGQSR